MLIAEAQRARGEKLAAHAAILSLNFADMRTTELLSGAEQLLNEGDQAGSSGWLADAQSSLPTGRDS
jgi:hypothetical protein